ncbi:potassium-transporting ATPase subunit F [Acidithiobacillus sp. IBUN Pt1247-S3]|uniref:potassium-transporting ATPase subunit F n=1 Tax=Acidithiobacillus sp. IBUN Pt1247-S3 TaxID=3166642 RepID=UPI0034E52507
MHFLCNIYGFFISMNPPISYTFNGKKSRGDVYVYSISSTVSRPLCCSSGIYSITRQGEVLVMSILIWIGLALALFLLVYLTLFLINPERFL